MMELCYVVFVRFEWQDDEESEIFGVFLTLTAAKQCAADALVEPGDTAWVDEMPFQTPIPIYKGEPQHTQMVFRIVKS